MGQEDPLEEGMPIHSSILAWRILWTVEPGRQQSMGSQRVRYDWATDTLSHSFYMSLRGSRSGGMARNVRVVFHWSPLKTQAKRGPIIWYHHLKVGVTLLPPDKWFCWAGTLLSTFHEHSWFSRGRAVWSSMYSEVEENGLFVNISCVFHWTPLF